MCTTRQKTGKTRETKNHDDGYDFLTIPPGSMPRLNRRIARLTWKQEARELLAEATRRKSGGARGLAKAWARRRPAAAARATGPPGCCSAGAAPARPAPAPNGCGRWRCGEAPIADGRSGGSRWSARPSRRARGDGRGRLRPAGGRIRGSERPLWQPSRRRLEWPNGAVAQVFSAEDPESLRGPQFAAAWCDELAKWRHAEATFDMLQFGLRLGERPRQVITTTPRPIALLKRLIADPRTAVTRAGDGATTPAIWRRLSSTRWWRAMPARGSAARSSTARSSRSAPTRCGRAARIEALPRRRARRRCRASWSRSIRRRRRRKGADACGLVAAGRAEDGIGYVLADETVRAALARRLGGAAIALWRRLEADALVAEVNQGGDMVRAVIGEVDAERAGDAVRAHARQMAARRAGRRALRAGPGEPRRRASRRWKTRCATSASTGLSSGRSPDRLDALVWAVTALMLTSAGEPRVQGAVKRANWGSRRMAADRDSAPSLNRADALASARRMTGGPSLARADVPPAMRHPAPRHGARGCSRRSATRGDMPSKCDRPAAAVKDRGPRGRRRRPQRSGSETPVRAQSRYVCELDRTRRREIRLLEPAQSMGT